MDHVYTEHHYDKDYHYARHEPTYHEDHVHVVEEQLPYHQVVHGKKYYDLDLEHPHDYHIDAGHRYDTPIVVPYVEHTEHSDQSHWTTAHTVPVKHDREGRPAHIVDHEYDHYVTRRQQSRSRSPA